MGNPAGAPAGSNGWSCFGATVSGRPPELDHVESMVGLFINTLPVRVTIDPAESLRSLLSRLQAEQAALLEHHQLGLTEIVKSVGNAADFDTLTVFESYPVDTEGIAATSSIDGMTVTAITGDDATHYPLTLTVVADDGISFTLKYQQDVFDAPTIEVLRERMLRILRAFVELPDTAAGNLDVLGPDGASPACPRYRACRLRPAQPWLISSLPLSHRTPTESRSGPTGVRGHTVKRTPGRTALLPFCSITESVRKPL